MYVNSLSDTTNYSATYVYLIVFQCKQKVPIFMKQQVSSPYSRDHVHVFLLTHIYSNVIFMPFKFKIHFNIILPVTQVWDSQAFLVCCWVPAVRQAARLRRVPRSDIRGTEIVFKTLPLSDRNLRHNRKWDINRIWIAVLRTLDSFKLHYTIPTAKLTCAPTYSKMELRFWRKLWQAGRISRQLTFCFFALRGGLVHIVTGHKKRADLFCGQWQKTVRLVRNRELTRGLTCPLSYSIVNELIFLRIPSNWNFVVSSVMVSIEGWWKKKGWCRRHFETLGIIQTCRNVSVRCTNRAPNVSCCVSSHMSVLLPCSDTALLLASNSESFVKVRVVARSANSPHIQFYLWQAFCKKLSRVCVAAGRFAHRLENFHGRPQRIHRPPNFNEHMQDRVLTALCCVETRSWEITFTAIHGDDFSVR